MATDSFTCKHAIPAFTPHPQSIAGIRHPLAGTHFTVPRRVEGWVDLRGWLHTEINCRPAESNTDTVTHLSTNRAQRRLTSLIKINALPLRQTATIINTADLPLDWLNFGSAPLFSLSDNSYCSNSPHASDKFFVRWTWLIRKARTKFSNKFENCIFWLLG